MDDDRASNGADRVTLEFRREDLAMVLSALRVGAATEMMTTGERGLAYRRMRAYADQVKALLPQVVADSHQEHIWPEIRLHMVKSISWAVEVRDDRSYGFGRKVVVIVVGDAEWGWRDSVRENALEVAEALRIYLREIAPLGCEERLVPLTA